MTLTRAAAIAALSLASAAALTGCLERRIYITSDPPGALVHLNDLEVGRTPVEVDFTYYGVYDVRLAKDGYDPLLTSAKAKAPIYELPLIDLAAEIIPTRIVTDIHWHFTLERTNEEPDAVIDRARALRERIGALPESVSDQSAQGEGIPVESEPAEQVPPDLPPILPPPRTPDPR
ncbi:MAG: PEGA domain-containing protein [Planctomycetota bacterium]|nr:PEGA domain-containing protein [Planctomycetota bacterium]